MQLRKFLFSEATLAIIGLLGIVTGSALAYQGDYTQPGPNQTPERHEAMEKAFASNDYSTWQKLQSGRGQVAQLINEDNFSQFAKARQLAKQGQYDEADAIRKSLGLRTSKGQVRKAGSGHRFGYHRMAK